MAQIINGVRVTASHVAVWQTIKKLCKGKNGFCWASNEYIGAQVGLSRSRVSHIVSDLHKATLVARHVIYNGLKQGEYNRQLHAFKEATSIEVRDDFLKKLEEAKTQDGIKARIIYNARAIGVNMFVALEAVKEYGTARVEQVLAMEKASYGIRNKTGWFKRALSDGWNTENKRVKRLIGKAYRRTRDYCTADALKDIALAKAQSEQGKKHDNDFVKTLNSLCPWGMKLAKANAR